MDLFEEKLVEAIRKFPCIYTNKERTNKALMIKEKCWKVISKQLNKKPLECKIIWRNLRDNYKKNKKKKILGTRGVSKYDDERLNFLEECFSESNPISNIYLHTLEDLNSLEKVANENEEQLEQSDPLSQLQSPEYEGEVVENSSQNNSTKKLKKKRTNKKQKRDDTVDELSKLREDSPKKRNITTERRNTAAIHSFFSSMADVVCEFPLDKIAQIRSQICNIVTEMELSIIAERDSQSYGSKYKME